MLYIIIVLLAMSNIAWACVLFSLRRQRDNARWECDRLEAVSYLYERELDRLNKEASS